MENLHEDKNIITDCKTAEEYIDSYMQLMKLFHEDNLCLPCLFGFWVNLVERVMFNYRNNSPRNHTQGQCGVRIWV